VEKRVRELEEEGRKGGGGGEGGNFPLVKGVIGRREGEREAMQSQRRSNFNSSTY
jgi:hypothetical protein